jgi:hypothetical protein
MRTLKELPPVADNKVNTCVHFALLSFPSLVAKTFRTPANHKAEMYEFGLPRLSSEA